jgi:phosphate ABC transporter, permease protein PstA
MLNKRSRVIKDNIMQVLIYLSAAFTVGVLAVILGFILYKGLPGINMKFLTHMWEDKTTFVVVQKQKSQNDSTKEGYVSSLGITIKLDEKTGNAIITKIDSGSPVKAAKDLKGNQYTLKVSDVLAKVDDTRIEKMPIADVVKAINGSADQMKIKAVRPGGGILPMVVSTLYMILLSLLIAAPVGILAAIYLNEYAKPGRILRIIRFAVQSLAGIPSIIYGLFGMLFFVQILKMQYSILAGSLTVSIILLPTIISTTEEALKAIPMTYRESSLGLGATKLQTNFKIVLPNAIPGILVAIILSIGRIVGESAALILTAGTVAQIPRALTGTEAGAATLTVKLYWLMKETGDISTACSIAIVLLALIIVLNIVSKLITRRFLAKRAS